MLGNHGGLFPENYAEWSFVHSRKHQLLNLPAPIALGILDIISTNPSYLAVTCSVCGVWLERVQETLIFGEKTSGKGFPQPAQCRARQWIHVQA